MSMHVYTRALDAQGRSDIDSSLLADEVIDALPGLLFTIGLSGDVCVVNFQADELDGAQAVTLYDVVQAHKVGAPARVLEQARAEKLFAIDQRTKELIASGFSYGGKRFSLSQQKQMNIVGSYTARLLPQYTYPVRWNTIDDLDFHDVVDAAEIEVFFLTAMGNLRVYVGGDTTLKDAARAATTLAELDAVVDSR